MSSFDSGSQITGFYESKVINYESVDLSSPQRGMPVAAVLKQTSPLLSLVYSLRCFSFGSCHQLMLAPVSLFIILHIV